MPGIKSDPTGNSIYERMKRQAERDGVVLTGAPSIAKELHLPLGTSRNALQRLQKKAKVAMLEFGKYVVVDIVE